MAVVAMVTAVIAMTPGDIGHNGTNGCASKPADNCAAGGSGGYAADDGTAGAAQQRAVCQALIMWIGASAKGESGKSNYHELFHILSF